MPCPYDNLAASQIEITSACIGNLWIFADLSPGELEALAAARAWCWRCL